MNMCKVKCLNYYVLNFLSHSHTHTHIYIYIYIYIYMEPDNGNESDSMKKIAKQSNPKVMNLS